MDGGQRDLTQRSDTATREGSDAEEVKRRYDAWLGTDATVVDWQAPEGTGYSSLTYIADVERSGTVSREVIRAAPTGAPVFASYDLGLQVACMRALSDVIPTPDVLAEEPDPAPLGQAFYVMAHVDGRIPSDNPPYALVGWLHDAEPDLQRAHYINGIDVLGSLHRVTPEQVGLVDHLQRTDLGATGLEQQIAWWKDLLAWGREDTEQPTIDAAWEWLDEHQPSDPGRDVVLWGDARISNMIFGPDGAPRAVLDWEMAGMGPGEIDLAWYLWMDAQFTDVFGAPRLPGYPGDDALVDRWQAAVGHDAADLAWYRVFAGVRFSTTMMRVALRSIADGLVPAGLEANHLGTRLLAQVLDLPEPGPIGMLG
jgi:aminoglycoside phosphotransferase (APT) family kinase protein